MKLLLIFYLAARGALVPLDANDKAVDNLVSEGVTAPRGTPVAYATTTPTARFPSI
ncbi:hypothetical protein AB8965_10890 [Yersinia enterocolitica]|uniref:hypothetical protein n=1 Tax=Yersinia enterocolitica TaxID=630 RepID=UPI001C8DE1E7|nr:hypothetical protein [Yersinia enterocolitica]MBX9495960.1 hypothetical protein [Yersinia enterocolitica]